MKLRNYITSKENLFLAIYSLKSYVYSENLLDPDDIELYEKLLDPFNEAVINSVIEDVTKIIENIIVNDGYYFKVQVYFMPKSYDSESRECKFRPIHITDLKQLIAMVSMLQAIIYEIPKAESQYKIYLSNYSRLIPQNFYGNKVSTKPEEIYSNWNTQYSKFVQKSNRLFKNGYEFDKYKYEVKLDIVDFFPSVNPFFIYQLLVENRSAIISDYDDINVFNTIIYKLLRCKITNLDNSIARAKYYNVADVDEEYIFTKGLPQGLPQSGFFGNICMVEISKIISNVFAGESLYYVDDAYVYTNIVIENKNMFHEFLDTINRNIKSMEEKYIQHYKDSAQFDIFFILSNGIYDDLLQNYYNIRIHIEEKSEYHEIKKTTPSKYDVRNLKRHVSQIGVDVKRIYSEKEEEILLHNTEALVNTIESELKSGRQLTETSKKRLISYYKFFKYRMIMLKLRTNNYTKNDLFKILLNNNIDNNNLNYKSLINYTFRKEDFYDRFQNDIWLNAVRLLIENTIYEHDIIKQYIKGIINNVYGENMGNCSYISRYFKQYLSKEYNEYHTICNIDKYATLKYKTDVLLKYYSGLNNDGLRGLFIGTRIRGITNNPLKSFNICSENFLEMSKIVQYNSNELQRMFLNAVYSRIFKVTVSDDFVLNCYDKKGITYGKLRCLIYLRNKKCNIDKFLNWSLQVTSDENNQIIDYSIINVLDIYRGYVKEPRYIDDLILVHKYTCDVWKNGAKHLYFYTLHNQEHAVQLIKEIVMIGKVFKNLNVSSYNYYIVFIACYLHDISMVKIANEKDFLSENDKTKEIVDLFESCSKNKAGTNKKELIIKIYKKVDEYYESIIRENHAIDSANEIRKREDLSFLDLSVRENVAMIAEAHGENPKDIYKIDKNKSKSIIEYTNDKILLRLADLMDMCRNRVTKVILNHNFNNISQTSAFHWISHLLTQDCELSADYIQTNKNSLNEKQGKVPFEEVVTVIVYVNFSQFSPMSSMECMYGKINDSSLNEHGFRISMLGKNEKCNSEKCNFLCRWFNVKNKFLVKEMQALQKYLSEIQSHKSIYDVKIQIEVCVIKPTNISDAEFQILKDEISKDRKES